MKLPLLLVATSLLAGCKSTPEPQLPESTLPTRAVTEKQSDAPILFLADPQVHNVYGLKVKQMNLVSNAVTKVAERPPELNILAPLVMRHLVDTAANEHRPEAIVVLGDSTNIACANEHRRFMENLLPVRRNGVPLLMAHGNHDSYLMGTANSYIPGKRVPNWRPMGMENSSEPTDQGWWGNDMDIHAGNQRNWRDACFEPKVRSAESTMPMNKSRWLSKYVTLLDLQPEPSEDGGTRADGTKPLAYSAKPGSVLSQLAYSAQGLWFPPTFGAHPSSKKTDLTKVSKSFIVQKVDFDDFRLVIIDTSVCESTYGGRLNLKFYWTNAGTNACIGENQFLIIKQYIDDTPEGKQLVIAGHFPLKDLTDLERETLIRHAGERPEWVYMSAHSHGAVSQTAWDSGWEINVGSTTDWPMEVNSLWFDRAVPPRVRTIRNELPEGFLYKPTPILGNAEVCRHLPAARHLVDLRTSDVGLTYESPRATTCRPKGSDDWIHYGTTLADYIETITSKFNDPDYRSLMLRIAAAASLKEYETRDLEAFGRRLIH